jgi:ATP-dependent Clp protease ATP-binding subunit ClpC
VDSEYLNVLEEGQDLVESGKDLAATLFRDAEVQAAVDALARNRPVLLIGPPGVGKTAVLQAVARRLPETTRVLRFTTAQIMSGTRYIGEWQSKLTSLMTDAEQSKAVLNIVDVWNLATVGTTAQSKQNLLDAMRPRLAEARLRLISEATPEQLHEMSLAPKFVSLFEIVRIEPLSGEQRREIIEREAARHQLPIDREARERLFQLCESFAAVSAGPGPALDLIDKIRDYREQKLNIGEAADVTPAFVEKVFAIHSGLPLFVVSRTESKSAAEIRAWFRDRIIGQEAAIDAVVEMIAFYKARLHDKGKPIGSFLFVGPTGVGKTELARALAEFFFGSERRMLRFDMSEFADYHSFEMLIGSPKGSAERPARLVDPVRLQPFQVLLFDELEKAHRNVQDLFLQLLDEGRLTTPRGETVNFCNTILIATSNTGAAEGMAPAIGFGGQGKGIGDGYDADKALQAIEGSFRPEFLNRFQHVVLFHPLTREQAMRIARIDLKSILQREGIASQNLIVDVHDDVIEHVVAAGFNARYGGRGIKRETRRQIGLPLATLLMERTLEPGTMIEVGLDDGRIRARVTDTPAAGHATVASVAVRTESRGRAKPSRVTLTREQVGTRIVAAPAAAAELGAAAGLDGLRRQIEEIDRKRGDYTFWHEPDAAGHILAQQTRWLEAVTRVERLEDWARELTGGLEAGGTRTGLTHLANSLIRFEAAIAVARRELVTMGPDGYWDALVEIAPIGPSDARDFLFDVYRNWAKDRRLELVMLHEPMAADEVIAVALRGPFAHGYLKAEAGHHRLRRGGQERGQARNDASSVARVRVAPWSSPPQSVDLAEMRPLKMTGQLGGKIRSRVAIAGSKLVLQNARTLGENRDLAGDVVPSWPREFAAEAPTVRRYDLAPFLVRDFLTKSDFTRKDILGPQPFHELLCARIDHHQS